MHIKKVDKRSANASVILMAIYSPGSKAADKLFFDEQTHVVEGLTADGRFSCNIWYGQVRARETYVKQGTLDFVASTSGYKITDVIMGTPKEFLDHALVTCLLPMRKTKPQFITKLYMYTYHTTLIHIIYARVIIRVSLGLLIIRFILSKYDAVHEMSLDGVVVRVHLETWHCFSLLDD
ncbi:hypothetical protein HELRODRAFT_164111 [Helobdella robusta]|uniref:Uncharacterized protein n=1 Tax=Helobdella robusta TaxID=6412 RepID=T1EUY1_HELRO|nr:hypothetical protein HELRODRAFT_164111 [Helobdella robusta]ESN94296.1 hypothetical protein HELRODRAFT_164111 [Helobdella robusta]